MLLAIGASVYIGIGLFRWNRQLDALNKIQERVDKGEELTAEAIDKLNDVGRAVSMFGYQKFVLITYISYGLFWLPLEIKARIELLGGKNK